MANKSGNAYALTTLCPIKNGLNVEEYPYYEYLRAFDKITRSRIQRLKEHKSSPFARIENTYFARLFVLNDIFFEQGNDVIREHLQSKYIVFTSTFHGNLDTWLNEFWNHSEANILSIWQHAVGFERVQSASDFVKYIKKCQIKTTLFFNGSDDHSLAQQLKALYIKQMFSEFVLKHQECSAHELRKAYDHFIEQTKLFNFGGEETWIPGQTELSPSL